MPAPPWHEARAEDVLARLSTRPQGLAHDEVKRRFERDGANRLSERRGASVLRKLLTQLLEPLVLVLIGSAAVSAALGELVDALVIGAVVIANAFIGFLQEQRAENAIAALDRLVVTEATVLRAGEKMRVRSEELVRGDIVLAASGDTVPADLRLLSTRDLQVEEAALTGESAPVHKATAPLPADTFLADRGNMAFAGTQVTYGQATGIVVETGDATEAGRIAGMLSSAGLTQTPLTRRIAALSRLLVWVILATSGLLFAVEALRGAELVSTFNAAVALAVGAIPEGLPAAVTVLLAVGVSAMARRGALIRRLPAVETLGSTTVICSDKTGTLTKNQMTVTALVVDGQRFEVTGRGYEPSGALYQAGTQVDPRRAPGLDECLRAGALCNDTRLRRHDGALKVEGDPTEAALLVLGEKGGFGQATREAFPRVDEVPFESEHMYMATLHRAADTLVAYVKGSSEVLLPRCVGQVDLNGKTQPCDQARVHAQVDELAREGLRVLLIARRPLDEATPRFGHEHIKDLTLLGIVGMIDPPREAAKGAVRACREAGILVKMITGDHAITASAIAQDLGLEGERTTEGKLRAVTGRELEHIENGALPQLAQKVAVFARVAPEQKLRLVRALQERGHVVAMTGDGVNDAPALKQADIGVAMGKTGTDVARSAAAMVLTDDDFATIAAAVEEGRGVYDNLVKFIAWTLPTNGGEGLVLLAAVVLGAELPILPVQLLWVNLATTVLLGMALVFEPKEAGLMQRPPRPVGQPLLGAGLMVRTGLVSALLATAAFLFFEWALADGAQVAVARTIAVNTIVVAEVAYLFACRSLTSPMWRLGFFSNRAVWLGSLCMLLAQLLFTYAPVMNRLFHTAPLPLAWWGVFTAAGAGVFVTVELKKLIAAQGAAKA